MEDIVYILDIKCCIRCIRERFIKKIRKQFSIALTPIYVCKNKKSNPPPPPHMSREKQWKKGKKKKKLTFNIFGLHPPT